MRETGSKPQRLDDAPAKLAAGSQFRTVDVAQVDRLHRDPLDVAADNRLGAVPGDVFIQDVAVRADRVEGVFLALDVFLDADLAVLADIGNGGFEGGPVTHLVGMRRAGAGDGLDHERQTDGPGSGADRVRARGGGVAGCAQAGGIKRVLHLFLVAEEFGLGRVHPAGVEHLAQLRGQGHERFPQAFDTVDRVPRGAFAGPCQAPSRCRPVSVPAGNR